MKVKKLLVKIKYTHILSALFLAFIFYAGTVKFPAAMINIGNFLKDEQADILDVRNKLDSEYRDMLAFRGDAVINKGSYINLNGLMANIMGQRYMNGIIKLDNGNLTGFDVNKRNVSLAAQQLTTLNNAQKERGKDFLFVLAPNQIPKYEDIVPVGYEDYSNENADNLIAMLRANNVSVLDLRDEMIKDGKSYSDAFFITDHHWKPETGFWAYAKIIDYFVQEGIMDEIDSMYTDANEFNFDVIKNSFLGSRGKRTGRYFAGVDDFTIITPKFETNISLEIPLRNIYRSGNFTDVAFSHLAIGKDYFNESPYELYGHGNNTGKNYHNEAAPIDMKILSIRDSFACTTSTFFPLIATICHELEFRPTVGGNYRNGGFKNEDGFRNFYYEFNPDIMIILVNADGIMTENMTYDFFNDLNN